MLLYCFPLCCHCSYWLQLLLLTGGISLEWQQSLQVSRTLLSILADLNNAVVSMVSACPPISISSSSLGFVLSALITFGITVIFMFHSFFFFFCSLARPKNLSHFSFSVIFTLWSAWTASPLFVRFYFFFFFVINTMFSLLAGIKWSVCILKCQRILCVSFTKTGSGLCIYYLAVCSNLNFLHNSLLITFSTNSCLVFYCAS